MQDFQIEKPSLYRMILRYINPNDEMILAKVTLTPENQNDAEQSYMVRLEASKEPRFVTLAGPSGNIPTPFVLNPGQWTATIATNRSLYLDYLAILPAAYYEATILQERVLLPCSADQEKGTCRHFTYPNLAHLESVSAETATIGGEDERIEAELITDTRVNINILL